MRPRKKMKAQRCSFTLDNDLKPRAISRAESLGMEFGPYVAALVRNDLLRPDADLIVYSEGSAKAARK